MNQPSKDISNFLTKSELMELSNLKEMRRSLTAVTYYMEKKEGAILDAARSRMPKGGKNHVQAE